MACLAAPAPPPWRTVFFERCVQVGQALFRNGRGCTSGALGGAGGDDGCGEGRRSGRGGGLWRLGLGGWWRGWFRRLPPRAKQCWRGLRDIGSKFSRAVKSPADVPEHVVLRLKRFRAVIPSSHDDDEIKLRDDADRLATSTQCANPMDLSSLDQGAAEPPQISIRLIVRRLDQRCRRCIDPTFGDDLSVVPTPLREDKLPNLGHVTRPQAQPTSGVGIAADQAPLCTGNGQRFKQSRSREFVEGASGRLANDGRHER